MIIYTTSSWKQTMMMQSRHRPAEGAANVCRVSDHNRVLFYFYLTFILSVNWVQKAQVPKAEQTGWWTFHQLNISVWGKIQNIKQTMWNIKIAIASNKYESSVYHKWHRILNMNLYWMLSIVTFTVIMKLPTHNLSEDGKRFPPW